MPSPHRRPPARPLQALACSVALALAGAAMPAAASTVLSSNLDQTSTDTLEATATDWLAISFVNTATLSSSDVLLATLAATTSSGTAALTLYSSDPSGLIPGSALAAFTATSSGAGTLGFSLTGTTLTTGSTYWLVLSQDSGASQWRWTSSNTGSGSGFTSTWADSTDAGATWFAESTLYPLQAAVSVSAVPEPASALCLLSGLAALGGLARQRRGRAQAASSTHSTGAQP